MGLGEGAGLLDADPLLEHRVRLAVCVLLSGTDEISFSRFKQLLQQTDGNLGAQLRKLEEAEYLSVRKVFEARKPVSWYRLSARGRQALALHLQHLRRLVAQAAV